MKQESIAAPIAALQAMSVGDLRQKYNEVFGEPTRSRHRDYLWKRIAWRMQAVELGDLSERARRRAAELANDADVRAMPPRAALPAPLPEHARTTTHAFPHVADARLPIAGTVLTRPYKGRLLRVTVLDDGFEYEGRTYRSLSAIASEVTGTRWNGFLFFGLAKTRDAAGAAL